MFKCVFERTISSTNTISAKITEELKERIAKKVNTEPNQIHLDTSTTHSIPMTPTNKESKSVILITKDPKVNAEEFLISNIPLVSSMSGKMNILRVYTQKINRKKVEIAAKSILGDLKL